MALANLRALGIAFTSDSISVLASMDSSKVEAYDVLASLALENGGSCGIVVLHLRFFRGITSCYGYSGLVTEGRTTHSIIVYVSENSIMYV